MKTKSKTSRISDRYGMIEPLEPRIAPAAVLTDALPSNPTFRTVTAGGSLLLTAGDVLTTGSGGGGSYLLYIEAGKVLVHTTDLNSNHQLDFNEITGLSVGPGARIVSFVDIHGDIVTDLNSDGSLSDKGKGDVLLDNNIAEIELRSLDNGDFVGTSTQTPAELVAAHLALSSYSIFGNIYAGGGVGIANDPTSGIHINTTGTGLQAVKYSGATGSDYYQATEPVIGSIYVGTSASGQSFNFGAIGSATDIHGNLLAFNPSPGEAGASVYNINAAEAGQAFSIGTIHAGNGGFNGPGGSLVNVALQGDNAGVYKLIAGNAGQGTVGQNGGNIINFSETGAIISEVVLQSGNGGTGLTGTGGNGGQITFNPAQPTEINAHVVITYGSGGDGYSKGGTGGGSASAKFVTPEGKVTTALDLVSTTRAIGSIGRTQSFDFNKDGYSDAVFSTTNPNQVVVALGNGSGGVFGLDSNNYIFLNAPAHVDAIVVGNFTGKTIPGTGTGPGNPPVPEEDIAVASGSGSFAGIEVFLSQYNPKTGAFEGFSDPLFTPIPAITDNSFIYSSLTVTKMVAGDFAGNGVLGLAVLVQETEEVTLAKDNVLLFLNGENDAAHLGGTGYFYANFANGNIPYVDLFSIVKNSTQSTILATALQTFTPTTPTAPGTTPNVSNGQDVVIETDYQDKAFNVIADPLGDTQPAFIGGGSYGKVDTDRPDTGKPVYVQFEDLTLTVTQDQANPANADIVAVSQTPVGYIQLFQGLGNGVFNLMTGTGTPQAGLYFADTLKNPVAMVTLPNQSGGTVTDPIYGVVSPQLYSNVAILDYPATGGDTIFEVDIAKSMTTATIGNSWGVITPVNGADATTIAFDTYVPHPVSNASTNSGPLNYGFITADPLTTFPDYQGFTISQPIPLKSLGFGGFNFAPFKTAGYYIAAGNGGNSQAGAGGAGGSFGQTLTVSGSAATLTATGSYSVAFPTDETFEGTATFIAGQGGNGFTNGGAGGNLVGVSVTYAVGTSELTGVASLFAGSGGESLTGTGGMGGSLAHLYVVSGEYFIAGDGGIGVIGGAGGSLAGNTQAGLVTAQTNNVNPYIELVGGNGANGLLGGGNGGGITSFVNDFNPIIGTTGGQLLYIGGNAGDAVAGQAGRGGSIVNSSPSSTDNNLAGDIQLVGGAGGTGLYAGGGGSITNFDNVSTVKDIPTSFTVIAGAGGNATLGTGGAGGSVSSINLSASGIGNYAIPMGGGLASYDSISYNRMVAGAGGSSAGGTGGAGGSINTITTASVASDGQNVAAAGAGGDGLNAGGAGGSVISASMTAGSTTGKVLVIAGDGGESISSKPSNAKNIEAVAMSVGAVNGPGGAGGSITNFVQPSTTNTHVDLIAGNGGATIGHSVAANNATVDNSGKGGSIINASVTGSIGNSDPTVAIKSYNDILSGVTMQDFVDNYILGDVSAPLNDAVGNVGLVAGAAGRVENGLASSNGVNGTVTNIHAENIMSMVAGNVEQVSLIQSLTNYGVTINGGILGAPKSEFYDPVTMQFQDYIANSTPPIVLVAGPLNYLNANLAYTNTPLPGGGILIDGAFVAKNIRTILSPRDFEGTQA